MKVVFTGHVEKGRLIFDQPDQRARHLATLEGKRFKETLKAESKRRTISQNSYLFGVIYPPIAQAVGDYYHSRLEVDEVHSMMKSKFASIRLDEGLVYTLHTHLMDTKRFSEYVDDVTRWAAKEYGCQFLSIDAYREQG
jgi:hypothetical protein